NLALQALRIAYKTGGKFEDVLREQSGKSIEQASTGKLGELLVEAEIISHEHLNKGIEKSQMTGLPLGRTLVLDMVIPESLLKAALDAQVRLRDEMLTREETIDAIRVAAGLKPFMQEGAPRPSKAQVFQHRVRLGELLVMAGILTESEVLTALEIGLIQLKRI